jgi:hypothetical protein
MGAEMGLVIEREEREERKELARVVGCCCMRKENDVESTRSGRKLTANGVHGRRTHSW